MGVLTQAERVQSARLAGKTWRVPIDTIDPAAGDDVVTYLRNKSDRVFEVYGLELMAEGAAGAVRVIRVTGTAGGSPTDVVPVNDNGTDVVPGDSDLQAVTDPDITGLTETFITSYSVAQDTSIVVTLPTGLAIVQGGSAIALAVSVATAVLSGAWLIMEAQTS